MQVPVSSNPKRFSMTYKERAAKVYVPMEIKLCQQLGVTRSELHLLGVKHVNNLVQNQKLDLMLV
jgi:hypothetical protein